MIQLLLTSVKSYRWLLATALIVVMMLAAAPIALQYGLQHLLLNQAQGVDRVEIGDINYNPFQSQFELKQLTLYRNEQRFAYIESLTATFRLSDLFQQRLRVRSLNLHQAQIPIHIDQNQTLSVAGIPLANTRRNTDQTSDGLAVKLGFDDLHIDQLAMAITTPKGSSQFDIQALHLSNLYMWDKSFGRFILDSQLNGAALKANLQLHLFTEQPKIVGTLRLDRLNLASLQPLVPTADMVISGHLNSDITFTLQQGIDGLLYDQQGQLALEKVAVKQAKNAINLAKLSWSGDLRYSQNSAMNDTAPTSSFNGTLALKHAALNTPSTQTRITQANWLGSLKVIGGNSSALQTNLRGQVLLTDLLTQTPAQGNNLALKIKHALWRGALTATPSQPGDLSASGTVALQQLQLYNPSTQLSVAQIGDITLQEVTLNTFKSIAFKQLTITDTTLAQPMQSNQPGLVELQKVTLDTALLTDLNQLQAGRLSIEGSQSQLHLDERHKSEQLAHLRASLPTSTTTETQSAPTEAAEFQYQLNGVQIAGDNQLHLGISQGASTFRKTITLSKLSLGAINSQEPMLNTPFSLVLHPDEFSKLSSQGTVQPLNPKANLQAKSTLNGLSLLDFSPLIEDAIGYKIQSGQLSVQATTDIKDNQINAQNKIHLHKLAISSAHPDKIKQFEQGFSVPLQAGLDLLQDKQDNIDLNLPITGDVTNPNFQLQSVISKALNRALAKASKTYLLLALQPFGAFLLAGEFASDQLSVLKLQSVTFDPGKALLSSQMQTYMVKIASLLKARKALQIKLCGGANELDRAALLQQVQSNATQTMEKTGSQTKPPSAPIQEISNELLLELATERQAAIKRQLLALGSSTQQIILCQPKIAPGTDAPSVDLGM